MKSILQTNKKGQKKEKITLKGYFKMLSEQKTPLQQFVERVMERCGVTEATVRNWCLYGIKPQSYAHVKVLMEITGLEEDELWEK